MFVYILLALFGAVFAFVESGTRNRHDNKMFYFFLFVFFLIVGLRYMHGDYVSYEMGFNEDVDVGGDFGYYYFQSLFYHIGFTFPMFVLLITLISTFALKQTFAISRWPIFGMVMILGKIFTLYAMSGIRQYIAMVLCWWALSELLLHRQRNIFLMLVCVAYSMHASAIIFFPVLFISKLKFTYRNAILILTCSMLIGAYSSTFFTSVTESSDLVYDRFAGYIVETAETGETMNLINYAENFLFLFLALLARKRAIQRVPFYDVFLYLFVVYCGFLIVGNEIGIIKRLRDYYAIAYAILVPSFVYIFKGRKARFICKGVTIAYFILLMFRSLVVYDSGIPVDSYSRMIPYHSVFQKEN